MILVLWLIIGQLNLNFMKIKHFFLLLLVISFIPNICRASEMVFIPASHTVQKGDLVKIGLYLNTGEDRINAAGGKLIFSSDYLSVSNISFNNSVLNFWPEQPHLDANGTISFSGVTPGGFDGSSPNFLFSVVFRAVKDGKADLLLKDAVALKDDGAGTASDLNTGHGSIVITAQSSSPNSDNSAKLLAEIDPKNDKELPESFTPLIGSNPSIFDGKYFLVFTTNDKQSGIDHYEVQESKNKSVKDDAWIRAESPYLLLDQTLHSFVFVRAFDKAQNIRLETMPPLYPQKFYQSVEFWVIIIAVCSVLLFLKRKLIFVHK